MVYEGVADNARRLDITEPSDSGEASKLFRCEVPRDASCCFEILSLITGVTSSSMLGGEEGLEEDLGIFQCETKSTIFFGGVGDRLDEGEEDLRRGLAIFQ